MPKIRDANTDAKVKSVRNGRMRNTVRWMLFLYDLICYLVIDFIVLWLYIPNSSAMKSHTPEMLLFMVATGAVFIFVSRFIWHIYKQIWRYATASTYLKLVFSDFCGSAVYLIFYYFTVFRSPESVFSFADVGIMRVVIILAIDLLTAIAIRLFYQYLYTASSRGGRFWSFIRKLLAMLTNVKIAPDENERSGLKKINIAIIGAGRVGAMLAEELNANPHAAYRPCCFVDISREKIGRQIMGLDVLDSDTADNKVFLRYGIQELVFALPNMDSEDKRKLYEHYRDLGCKMKVYDYSAMGSNEIGGKRQLREFEIEELLFRKEANFLDDKCKACYGGMTVLITGGGGSIGSEICRQVAKMNPKRIIILDIYENNAYDLQQEMKLAWGDKLDLQVEICSVCDYQQIRTIFGKYHPDIVLHAAAHKHVPLMEHNCCEAIRNNISGTYNCVRAASEFGAKHFIMVSTDKAVNPTNVMGATKRMCEMIVQSFATLPENRTIYSATRFGNVLGSAGSVIPLFKKQIQKGGPVTVTDKRIIRYFMTIPEASQLVLLSGAIAKNGELFVLDMGKPVKILEMAENMIRLCGLEPYKDIDIIETGLRPGEKLYEELLIKSENVKKTENNMIFVEHDEPKEWKEIESSYGQLMAAAATNDDELARQCLHNAVSTFHTAEEVNRKAQYAEQMRMTEV